jgi:hypothetical protein
VEENHNPISYRRCTGCGRIKDLTVENFKPDHRSSRGFIRRCKVCVAKQRREKRQSDPQKAREQVRSWPSQSPEKTKERNAKYYRENKEKRLEKQKEINKKLKISRAIEFLRSNGILVGEVNY